LDIEGFLTQKAGGESVLEDKRDAQRLISPTVDAERFLEKFFGTYFGFLTAAQAATGPSIEVRVQQKSHPPEGAAGLAFSN
jgi:hypothetical protein